MEDQLNQKDIAHMKEAIGELKASVVTGFASVNARLDFMSEHFIRRDELDRELSDRDKEIASLQDNQKWVVRTIMGVVILALLSLVVINT